MRRLARSLRLDEGTWKWLDHVATGSGAISVALGAYLILAVDRYGWPVDAPRATVRFVLVGLYGWVWLTVSSFVVVRVAWAVSAPIVGLFRLTGHAHLPLLVLGIVVQVFAVMGGVTGLLVSPALFAGLVWMPAMTASAVRVWGELNLSRAATAVVVPYLVWALIVGRHLWSQLDHLL